MRCATLRASGCDPKVGSNRKDPQLQKTDRPPGGCDVWPRAGSDPSPKKTAPLGVKLPAHFGQEQPLHCDAITYRSDLWTRFVVKKVERAGEKIHTTWPRTCRWRRNAQLLCPKRDGRKVCQLGSSIVEEFGLYKP